MGSRKSDESGMSHQSPSRNELLEKAERILGLLLKNGYTAYADDMRDIWDALRAASSEKKEQAWIAEDQQLPPLQQVVLVLTSDGQIALDYRLDEPHPERSHGAAHLSDEVYYWHLIPSAPSHLPRSTVALAANRQEVQS